MANDHMKRLKKSPPKKKSPRKSKSRKSPSKSRIKKHRKSYKKSPRKSPRKSPKKSPRKKSSRKSPRAHKKSSILDEKINNLIFKQQNDLSAIINIRKERDLCNTHLATSKQESQVLRQKLDLCNTDLEKSEKFYESLQKRLDDNKKTLEDLKKKSPLEQLLVSTQVFSNTKETTDALKAKKTKLDEELKTLTKEKSSSSSKVTELETTKRDTEKKIADIQTKLNELERSIASTTVPKDRTNKSELEKTRKDADKLNVDITKIENNKSELEKNLKTDSDKLAMETGKLEDLKTKIIELKTHKAFIEATIESINTTVTDTNELANVVGDKGKKEMGKLVDDSKKIVLNINTEASKLGLERDNYINNGQETLSKVSSGLIMSPELKEIHDKLLLELKRQQNGLIDAAKTMQTSLDNTRENGLPLLKNAADNINVEKPGTVEDVSIAAQKLFNEGQKLYVSINDFAKKANDIEKTGIEVKKFVFNAFSDTYASVDDHRENKEMTKSLVKKYMDPNKYDIYNIIDTILSPLTLTDEKDVINSTQYQLCVAYLNGEFDTKLNS